MLLEHEHSVVIRQTSKWGQIFLLSLVGLGATAFGTAWLYRIDEVISVQGKLVPLSGGVEIKSPQSNQLSRLLVKAGDKVNAGDTLLEFDAKDAQDERLTIKERITLEEKRFTDQLQGFEQRKKTLERNILLTTKILNRLGPLQSKGAISELQILQQENNLESQKDQLIGLVTRILEAKSIAETRIAELNGRLKLIENKLRYETIKAPITGVVFDMKPDNDKYVAMTAETLMKIVPEGRLSAEVNVANQDIGFLQKGQSVKVRVNSFPYTEYGEINGVITNIGADALPPNNLIPTYHFPVNIDLNRSNLETRDGTKIQLQAGMTITTNLKLRDRRLIELLGDLFADKSESIKRLRQP